MKELLPLAAALLIAFPAYAQVDLGTSASVTNPQRTGDATTGLFSPAASSVAIAGGGVQQMLINDTGVGIGTSSPAYLLDVNLNIANNMRLLSDPGSVNGFIEAPYGNLLFSSNAYYNSNFYYEQAGYASVFQIEGNSGDFVFDTAPSGTAGSVVSFVPVVHITNSGSVGIGTTAPAAMLDVGIPGTKLGTARLEGSASGYVQIQPAAAAGSWTMTLPTSAGTSGYVLATNGTGITSWAIPGATAVQEAAGQLQCSGANCSNGTGSSVIQFCPYKGNIKTTASQGNYTIPSSCLAATLSSMYVGGVGSSSVAANTLYYIYLWNVSGTWVLDAETTGHATDATSGIEIKSGDNTKTLLGMIHTDGSLHVAFGGATASHAGTTNTVATWDNRRATATNCSFSANRTTTATGAAEVNSENRCLFMNWSNESAIFTSDQTGSSNTAGGSIQTIIYIDTIGSLFPVYATVNQGVANALMLLLPTGVLYPAEGFHFTILGAAVSPGSTVTYQANQGTNVTTFQ